MIEINLVPDVKQELIKAQKVRSKVIAGAIFVGLASVAVVVLLAIYVFGIQTARGLIADGQINSKSNQLLGVTDLSKTLTIQNQLTKISTLNNSKNIDSRVFDLLNAIIPPAPNDVQISDLTVDSTTRTITINGQATNSYAAVEVFKKTIQGAVVKYDGNSSGATLASNISTSNTSYGEDSSGAKVLTFTLSFEYTPELFSPKSQNVSIVVTTQGNVTDSYLGVPKSIFADYPATTYPEGK
jgi:Tfp pilus assembly protein PilN